MPSPEIMVEPRPVRGRPKPPSAPEPREPLLPGPAKPRKPRRVLRFIGTLLLAFVVWSLWAAYAVYDLSAALDSEDAVALERRIEWSSVRQGLREDLAVMLGSSQPLDGLTTQRAIVALIRAARFNERGWDIAPPPGQEPKPVARPDRGLEPYRIRYAFFSGGPFAFRIDVKPDSDAVKRPLVLLFRWTGDWRLARVFLPSDAFGATPAAAPAPPPAAAPAAPPAAPAVVQAAPAGSQRAVLYEEDSSDPNGKSYTGFVTWRSEPVQPAAGGTSEQAVIAQVTMPDRPLSLTLTIRRNLDKSLPASHTIDVKFDLPANSPTGGVLDMVGIMMKPNEEAAGQQLAGTRVKVSKDAFLMGLSAIELDLRHNTQIIKERSWVGIPFVYGNNNRAVLSIEKGETGEKILADALAQWSAASAPPPAPAPPSGGQRR